MVIRYPNGQSSAYDGGKKQKLQEKIARPKTFANRGMRFEEAKQCLLFESSSSSHS